MLGGALASVVLLQDAANLSAAPGEAPPYEVVGWAAWVVLLLWTLVILISGHFSGARWRETVVTLIVLAGTVAHFIASAAGRVVPWLLLLFIALLVVTIRGIRPMHPILIAIVEIAVVIVVVALQMVVAEKQSPKATITNLSDALIWTAGGIFHFDGLLSTNPVTPEGKFLGALAIIVGILLAGAIFTAVTAWIVQTGPHGMRGQSAPNVDDAVRQALIEAGMLPQPAENLPHVDEHPADPRFIIDVDRVVGSQPRTWGVPRGEARRWC